MNIFSKVLAAALTFVAFQFDYLTSETIVFRTPEGEISSIEVQTECSFAEVIAQLRDELHHHDLFANENSNLTVPDNTYFVDFMVCSNYLDTTNITSKGSMRQYNAPLTANEKKKIAEIIETLGNSSLVSIAGSKSSIEKKSKDVDTVHPLQFLGYIFSDERIKAAMHNLHGRGWVWSKFSKGLKDGLETEYNNQNLLQYIPDFCKRLGIDPKNLTSLAEKQRWKDFIEALFIEIPRPETSTRYDM